jgi:hypothetical protein
MHHDYRLAAVSFAEKIGGWLAFFNKLLEKNIRTAG